MDGEEATHKSQTCEQNKLKVYNFTPFIDYKTIMNRAYKTHNEDGIYFISLATVGWIDVFTKKSTRILWSKALAIFRKQKVCWTLSY